MPVYRRLPAHAIPPVTHYALVWLTLWTAQKSRPGHSRSNTLHDLPTEFVLDDSMLSGSRVLCDMRIAAL